MASTEITLILEGGSLVPNQDTIPVVANDTVTFATSDGRPAFLYFSPATIAILSPTPSIPFPLSASAQAQFTFQSSDPGAYTVLPSLDEIEPPSFAEDLSPNLSIVIIPPPLASPMPVVGSRTRDNQG